MNVGKVGSVKVRMYRHGFGDCFLISFFSQRKRVFSILVDCGIKHNTRSEKVPIEDVIDDLKRTLTPRGGKKPVIDVLVATHEHWDHISFFHPTTTPDFFGQFEIRQIWLAWTEDPDDDEAVAINSRLREGVAALQLAAASLREAESHQSEQFRGLYFGKQVAEARQSFNKSLNDVLGFYGAGVEAGSVQGEPRLSVVARKKSKTSESGIKYKKKPKISVQTETAMMHIISLGKKGGIKYLEPGAKIDKRRVPDGVNVFVLGPPRSSLINKSNPSSGPSHETYFGIGEAGLSGFVDGVLQAAGAGNEKALARDSGAPFGKDVGAADAENDPYFKQTYFDAKEAYRQIEHAWLDVVGQFSLQLDGAINNTSLVLAIELEKSGKVLLFPGDAQVGSWLSWHAYQWKVKRGDKTETITAEDLLKNTVLYKVSHHGSHNATVKEKGLELMTHPDLVAMIPEKEKSYHGILYQPLMKRLRTLCKGRVLVSADAGYRAEALIKNRPAELSAAEWKSFKDDLKIDPLYIEYTIR